MTKEGLYHVRSIDRDTISRNTSPLIQMPRRMTIAPHLSTEELQARFRHAKIPTVAHHYQIMRLLACRKTTAEVRAVTSYSPIRFS